MNAAISHVSIGVASMQAVRELWVDAFGLEIVAQRAGPDPDLARLWNVEPAVFAEQLLLRTPGAETGMLHFVAFSVPCEAVRQGAVITDSCAKNIDVNCTAMPAKVERLRKAGHAFRSAISEYEVGGLQAREVQMPVHDEVNVVLIEVLSDGFDCEYSAAGFAAVTSFIVVVPDMEVEASFYKDVFGLAELMNHQISGPGIEMAVGLPEGSALDMRLLGSATNLFGRVELIRYQGVAGANLFPRTTPPALGILRCGFRVGGLKGYLSGPGQPYLQNGPLRDINAIYGAGDYAVFRSPAGLTIEVATN